MRSSFQPPSSNSRLLSSFIILFISVIMIIAVQFRFLYHNGSDSKKGNKSLQVLRDGSHFSLSEYDWIMATPLCSNVDHIIANVTQKSITVLRKTKYEEKQLQVKSDPLCIKNSCGKHSHCFLGI